MTESHEQAPTELADELFEQVVSTQPRIDREAGVIYRAHVLGNVSKHGYSYSTSAQRAVVGRFEQMTVGLDHDYAGGPLKVSDAWGTLRNPYVDNDGTWADLHYLKSHTRTEQILEDVERGTGIFSLSCVNGKVVEHGKVISSFLPSRVDLVCGGATTRTLLEQAAVDPVVVEAPVVDATVVLREQVESLTAKLSALEQRLTLHEQFVAPTIQETIKAATVAVDLSKYWNDFPKDTK